MLAFICSCGCPYNRQSDARQLEVLGPARYQLLKVWQKTRRLLNANRRVYDSGLDERTGCSGFAKIADRRMTDKPRFHVILGTPLRKPRRNQCASACVRCPSPR